MNQPHTFIRTVRRNINVRVHRIRTFDWTPTRPVRCSARTIRNLCVLMFVFLAVTQTLVIAKLGDGPLADWIETAVPVVVFAVKLATKVRSYWNLTKTVGRYLISEDDERSPEPGV